jgi:hypothetical protein
MAMGDSVLWAKPKSTILDDIKEAAARGQQTEKEAQPPPEAPAEQPDPLPRPGWPYKAHSRHMTRPEMMLFLVGPDYLPDGFAYADLRRCRMVAAANAGKGPDLLLTFTDAEVRIEGRGIDELCYTLGRHLLPWVWQHPSPGDFKQEAMLIRKITVSERAQQDDGEG